MSCLGSLSMTFSSLLKKAVYRLYSRSVHVHGLCLHYKKYLLIAVGLTYIKKMFYWATIRIFIRSDKKVAAGAEVDYLNISLYNFKIRALSL